MLANSFSERLANFGTSLLRLLPPEFSHHLGLKILNSPSLQGFATPNFPNQFISLATDVPGIGNLKHPIGLAAGFDKNAVALPNLLRFGFSFLETGTVTPLPQPGNPKPRLFRLRDQMGLINRMGFNSDGSEALTKRLQALHWDHRQVPIGVNIGKNKITANEAAVEDYISCYQSFKNLGKYIVVNLSSPNTVGLRDLANIDFLSLLGDRLASDVSNVWIKLDPDQTKHDFQKLIESIVTIGFRGVILTNTHRVNFPESGGLSGHALGIQSTAMLEWAHEVHRGGLTMIASGGILTGQDVFEKLARGAAAVQIYTALVYRGPWAVVYLIQELSREMKLRGFENVKDIIGSFYKS